MELDIFCIPKHWVCFSGYCSSDFLKYFDNETIKRNASLVEFGALYPLYFMDYFCINFKFIYLGT